MLIAIIAASAAASTCTPSGATEFICGIKRPEDLVALDGTPWIAASSYDREDGNLYLIDSRTRAVRPVASPGAIPVAPDPAFPCAAPVSMRFATHGLAKRRTAPGRFRLFAVNHGARESIEIFSVDARDSVPRTAWIGCIPMAKGVTANGVATLSDGAVIFSETVGAADGGGLSILKDGRPSGGVYIWRRGETRRLSLPGIAGPNGLLTSADDRWLFVNAWSGRALWRIDLREKDAPAKLDVDFLPDNMRWAGKTILSAGQATSAATFIDCISAANRPAYCAPGWKAVRVDPDNWTVTRRFEGAAAGFGDVTVALPVEGKFWLGSVGKQDRIAIVDSGRGLRP